MKLNNGVLILLGLSSLLLSFSANAICVPRNSSEFQDPATSPAAPISNHVSVVPTASPPASSPSPPDSTSTPSYSDVPSSGGSGMLDLRISGGLNSVTSNLMDVSFSSDLTKICEVTSNPQLCANSITPYLHGSIDPVTALKTEIRASIKEVEKAISRVTELRSDASTSSSTIECLDTCRENFDSAIDDLKAGLESISGHDVGRMESVLTAVMSDLTTCDDTFAELGVDSPLDDLTTKMIKYASNCLAISKLLL